MERERYSQKEKMDGKAGKGRIAERRRWRVDGARVWTNLNDRSMRGSMKEIWRIRGCSEEDWKDD